MVHGKDMYLLRQQFVDDECQVAMTPPQIIYWRSHYCSVTQYKREFRAFTHMLPGGTHVRACTYRDDKCLGDAIPRSCDDYALDTCIWRPHVNGARTELYWVVEDHLPEQNDQFMLWQPISTCPPIQSPTYQINGVYLHQYYFETTKSDCEMFDNYECRYEPPSGPRRCKFYNSTIQEDMMELRVCQTALSSVPIDYRCNSTIWSRFQCGDWLDVTGATCYDASHLLGNFFPKHHAEWVITGPNWQFRRLFPNPMLPDDSNGALYAHGSALLWLMLWVVLMI